MTLNHSKVVDPLRDLLGDVLLRLEALESKVGISQNTHSTTVPHPPHSHHHHPLSSGSNHTKASTSSVELPASVKAYDQYVQTCVVPFCTLCRETIPDLQVTADLILQAWETGIRTMIVLAARSKPPVDEMKQPSEYVAVLQPHIQSTIMAVQEIRANKKIDRKYDIHMKAIYELISCVSWVYLYNVPSPHQGSLPVPFLQECMSSSVFWLNRIRKDFKDNTSYMQFCDTMKPIFTGLVEYVKTYHTTGLTFNPKGISLAEAAIRYTDEMNQMTSIPTPGTGGSGDAEGGTMDTAGGGGNNSSVGNKEVVSSSGQPATINDGSMSGSPKRTGPHPTLGSNVIVGGNVAGIIGELSKRTNADGTSAATGLKRVTKDQQTWRKEYKKDEANVALPVAPSLDSTTTPTAVIKKEKKKPLMGLPIFEYQDRGFKWVIENHTKESVLKEPSTDSGIIKVDISDPKQQVYLYNCDGITVKINGKFKSLVLDKCEKCSVVYDTVISSAEMVNCKKIQLQVDGVCPVFTIDKTINVLIWLSAESAAMTSFTTSLSSEMNISFPDGENDDRKEVPIPEQFVHKLNMSNNTLSSVVSDLYN